MYVDVNHPILGILSEELIRDVYPNTDGSFWRLYLLMHGAEMAGMHKTFNNLLWKKYE